MQVSFPLSGRGGEAEREPAKGWVAPRVLGTGKDCRNKASLSWYADGMSEAQRGGVACPRAHSRAGPELAS